MNGLPEYFANKTGKELLNRLNAKIDAYYEWLLSSGRLARWKTAYDTYYGQRGNHNSSWVTAAGEQQELSFLMSNEYRNLVQHLLVMSTATRPAMECVAANADFKSRAQAMLGNGVLEHYFRERKVERVIKATLEISLVTDIAWCFPVWDMSLGDPVAVDPDSGATLREGDVKAIARTGLDVIFDFARLDPEAEQDWIIVHDFVNKYDVAAMLPEKKGEVLAVERDYTKDSLYRFGDIFEIQSAESDLIDRHTFFHAKTPACPEGKMVIWYGTSVEGFNGPLPFRKVPASRCVPTEQILSSMGYSNANDLLGLQDVIDGCISAATTNVMNFGVNNLWSPNKSTIDFDQIAQGLNVIKSDTKPELLEFAKIGGDTIELMRFLIDRMQTLSGVNSVARGDIGGKDLSGAAMALLQSMAIQFNNGLQAAYSQLIEDVGTQIIYQLQDFATTERTAMIAGKNNRYMLEAFHSGKLDKISRVYVNQANPLRNTTSGRLTIAKELLTAGLLKHPDEYIQVLETGKLEPAVDDTITEQMAIQAENESLAEGGPVKAVWTDDHQRHINGHKMAISDPEARMDGDLVQRVLLHIQEHIGLMQQPLPIMDPMALGQPPQPGQSSQKALPPGQAGSPEVSDTAPQDGDMPNQPGMPKNALTGQEWNPETGGLPTNLE